jgi:hypothetical protein
MMKKAAVLLLILAVLFTISITTQATTIFYFGGIIGGRETFDDFKIDNHFTGSLSAGTISYTYLKKIKIYFEHESGSSLDNISQTRSTELMEFKLGYPVVNDKKGLIYITAGFLEYTRHDFSRATGGMLGINIVSILHEAALVEMDFQYSVLQSEYKIYLSAAPDPPPLSIGMASYKLQIQFILTDHLALVMSYRGIYSNVDNQNIIDNLFLPSIGLSYRI